MSFGSRGFSDFWGDDPFERMNRMMSSMDSAFNDPFFGGPGGRLQQQQQQRRGQWQQDGPIIEEVDDQMEHQAGNVHRPPSGPIVEEPEDGGYFNHSSSISHFPQRHGASSGVRINVGAGGIPEVTQYGNGVSTMFSYSSSTSSYNRSGQGNPVIYSSSSTTRVGPGGVRETTSTMRDGRRGEESITISRALGARERTITRTRNAHGQEEQRDLLNNIGEGETAAFDEEWMHQAANLPGGRAPASRSRPGTRQPRIGYR